MKTIVITGASSGIGKAAAEKFLTEGWQVKGTSTDGNGWVYERIEWVALDLTDPKSIERAAGELVDSGPFDALINNAGIYDEDNDREGEPVSIPSLRRTLEINLIGTIDFTERILPALSDGAHIISLGSGWGSLTENRSSDAPAYSISKAGLSMYTRRLSARLVPRHITVSILSPGWTKTDMGGSDAPRVVAEPAEEIYSLATSDVPSGRFWERGKERSW